MAFPTKTQIPVAASSRSNFTLKFPHVTTANFMEFGVSLARELVPKQEVDVKHECFSRLEPLVLPTFGEAYFKHRAFFVPFRTVFPAFTDMMEGVPHVYNDGTSAIPTTTPVLYESDITFMFVNGSSSRPFVVQLTEEEANNPDVKYDFELDVSVDSTVVNLRKFNLTPLGRRIYKMFVSLGMKFTFSYTSTAFVSALPLFCAARVYLDWFFTSQYAHTSGYTAIQKYLIKNDDVVDAGESFVLPDDLAVICETLSSIFYEPDYFVSAWDNPTGPNQGLQASITIPDIDVDPTGVHSVKVSNNSEYIGSSNPQIRTVGNYSLSGISNYMLTAVKKLGDYLKRNQLVGSRAVDRFYARFGIQLPAEAMDRSYLISEYSQVVKFGDVTSMASTDSATLGDYAGKGISFGDGSFKYTATERGYLIVITSIVPKTYYYQGIDRMALHTSPLDFWIPEFDALGVQAIASQELYKPQDERVDGWSPNYDQQVFGFVPRNAEYKTSNAIISGDYILRSRNVGKDAWTLFRDVTPQIDGDLGELVHSYGFTTSDDSNQYNRIFYNTSENADHFNIVHNFVINTSFPGKSLFDTYEFDDEDKSQKVTVGLGGTNLS